MKSISETWKDIPKYEGRYQVSNFGQVRSLPNKVRNTTLLMKQSERKSDRRLVVNLTSAGDDGKWKQRVWEVQQLVAAAFIGSRPDGLEVCHNDGNCQNNHASNLRYDTPYENIQDRKIHDGCNKGELNGQAKLTEEQVKEIKRKLIESDGKGVTAIAREYDVSHALIGKIKRGNIWSNL